MSDDDQDQPDMEYLEEMHADFARLAATGVFFLEGDALEELHRQIDLYCGDDANVRLYWRPGVKEDGSPTWWFYFKDMDDDEILEGGNDTQQCPPNPLPQCQ